MWTMDILQEYLLHFKVTLFETKLLKSHSTCNYFSVSKISFPTKFPEAIKCNIMCLILEIFKKYIYRDAWGYSGSSRLLLVETIRITTILQSCGVDLNTIARLWLWFQMDHCFPWVLYNATKGINSTLSKG